MKSHIDRSESRSDQKWREEQGKKSRVDCTVSLRAKRSKTRSNLRSTSQKVKADSQKRRLTESI